MPIEALFTGDPPVLRFVYQDARGDITERQATPQSLVIMRAGGIGMRAQCALRNAGRTFALQGLRSILALDGQPHPTWSDLETAIHTPLRRLQHANAFSDIAPLWPPSAVHWTDVAGTDTGLAWRDTAGAVRMDPAVSWGHAAVEETHHARLAQRAARNRAAQALLALCPPQAQEAIVHQGRCAWRQGNGPWQRLV